MTKLSKNQLSGNDLITETTFSKTLTAIMPRQNGTAAGLTALQAAILRGKELVK